MRFQSSDRTIRPILIGFALIILNIIWLIKTEVIWGTLFPTWLSLFPNVVFTLFVLSIISILLKRFSPRLALSGKELTIIYVMLSVATAIYGRDTMRIIFHCVGGAYRGATPENDWAALFWKYLPDWLTVSEQKALESFYGGGEQLHISDYVQIWGKPFLIWGSIVFVVAYVTACMSSIIRKQSVEYEHLSFPLIQLPIRMVVDRRRFLGNRLMWIGFAVGGAIDILNGLHFLYPTVPNLRIDTDVGRFFTEKPWNAMGWTPLRLYPFAVGLSYVMPLDISFSCWVFYILFKVQLILRSMWGWGVVSYKHLGYQCAGAWICIGVAWVWSARRHIGHVFLVAAGRREPDDADEAMRYRTVVPSLVLGIVVLVFFAAKAGMAVWVAVSFFLLYFVLAFAVARMRAQLGPPTLDIDRVGPGEFLTNFVGMRRIGPASLSLFPLFSWLGGWDYRALPIGHQLEGLKMAEQVRMSPRKMIVIIMLAAALTTLVGPWIFVHYAYQEGIEGSRTGGVGPFFFRRLEHRLSNLLGPDLSTSMEMVAGFGAALILSVLRHLSLSWPLHPIGFGVSGGSYIMNWLWFSVFAGWFCKRLLLKYWGPRTYRRASSLFLGMILGQYVVGSLWTVIGIFLGREMYGFFP